MADFTLSSQSTFPESASVGAYPRSAWPATSRTGAPSGSATDTSSVGSDGTIAFTGLADETEYVAYAQVSGVDRYIGFSTPTPDVTGGGGGEITDVVLLGTDIDLDVGWAVTSTDNEGYAPARLYKQGGRAYATGGVVTAAGSGAQFCELPVEWAMERFGDADAYAEAITASDSFSTIRHPNAYDPGTGLVRLKTNAASAGNVTLLDGLSWPLATP